MPKFVIALALAAVFAVGVPHPADAALTEGDRLASVYDLILAARFDAARSELQRTCPPAPAEACLALSAVAVWWQVQLNPNDRDLDALMEHTADAAIAAAGRWTAREPARAEAWFYLAGSYAPLVNWRVLRGQRLAAARDGKKIKDALERALALDPSLQDAWFGIGLYHYYADVAPAALKLLRMLLLLPGGDREQGLREMLRARDAGQLLRGEADFQLHWIFLWYENQPQRALELVRALDARYPSNPLFVQRVAEIEDQYFHDHRASAAAWQRLIDRAQRGESSGARIALAYYELGRELAHLGERAGAIEAFDTAIARAPSRDPDDVRARARTEIKKF